MNNENTKHNGWTNYATWRVNLEIFDGYDNDNQPVNADELKDHAEMMIEDESDDGSCAAGYALAFLQDVSWQEIADSINDAD